MYIFQIGQRQVITASEVTRHVMGNGMSISLIFVYSTLAKQSDFLS